MSNTIAPFIITLAKTANGYLFDSIEEHLKAPKKPKSALRTANQKNANRLIREIDINSETQKQEESVLVPAPVGPGQEVPPAEL